VWLADPGYARNTVLLDSIELARREAYRREVDRDRFTTGALLLRLAIAASTGTPADRVVVDRRCSGCGKPHGKPQLPGTGLHVSVSHSGRWVAVAVTEAGPVGVDVEEIRDNDTTGLAELCLAPAETVREPRDFFTYWCRKESVVKATGDGLRMPLAKVVVSRADEPARLIAYPGADIPAASMADLEVGAGYAGAVTVLAAGGVELDIADPALLAPN
jgi:4'-phosphopantetheinyl transferase